MIGLELKKVEDKFHRNNYCIETRLCLRCISFLLHSTETTIVLKPKDMIELALDYGRFHRNNGCIETNIAKTEEKAP